MLAQTIHAVRPIDVFVNKDEYFCHYGLIIGVMTRKEKLDRFSKIRLSLYFILMNFNHRSKSTTQ